MAAGLSYAWVLIALPGAVEYAWVGKGADASAINTHE